MIIYIIRGTSGEYSDRVEWLHSAYINRDIAEKNVLILNEMTREGYIRYENCDDYDKRNNIREYYQEKFKTQNFSFYYKPDFYLEELELVEEIK